MAREEQVEPASTAKEELDLIVIRRSGLQLVIGVKEAGGGNGSRESSPAVAATKQRQPFGFTEERGARRPQEQQQRAVSCSDEPRPGR